MSNLLRDECRGARRVRTICWPGNVDPVEPRRRRQARVRDHPGRRRVRRRQAPAGNLVRRPCPPRGRRPDRSVAGRGASPALRHHATRSPGLGVHLTAQRRCPDRAAPAVDRGDHMRWVRAMPSLVRNLPSVTSGCSSWRRSCSGRAVATGRALALLGPLDRYRARDNSPDARRQRRVNRLLRWYPAVWRTRYGHEMATWSTTSSPKGRGGARLSLNMAKEGNRHAPRRPGRRQLAARVRASGCVGFP